MRGMIGMVCCAQDCVQCRHWFWCCWHACSATKAKKSSRSSSNLETQIPSNNTALDLSSPRYKNQLNLFIASDQMNTSWIQQNSNSQASSGLQGQFESHLNSVIPSNCHRYRESVRHIERETEWKTDRVNDTDSKRQSYRQTESLPDLVVLIPAREYNRVGAVIVSTVNTSNMRSMYASLTHLCRHRHIMSTVNTSNMRSMYAGLTEYQQHEVDVCRPHSPT